MKETKIALRYCGGCNPRYDRAALISRLKRDFPELKLEPYSGLSGEYHGVLVICGCTACCANQHDLPADIPRCIIAAEEMYQKVAALCAVLDRRI